MPTCCGALLTAMGNSKSFVEAEGEVLGFAMFNLRVEQMDSLKRSTRLQFEERMLVHLERFAPKHFQLLSADTLRKVIQEGSKRAEAHGLTSQRSIRIYIEIMLMLGGGFAMDPQVPWAAALLADEDLEEAVRMDRLYEKVWDYIDHVKKDYVQKTGDVSAVYLYQQLGYIQEQRSCELSGPHAEQFREALKRWLQSTMPNKCRYIGGASIDALLHHCDGKVRRYEITTERWLAFFATMSFMLGADFDSDPQLPWVSQLLSARPRVGQYVLFDDMLSAASENLGSWMT